MEKYITFLKAHERLILVLAAVGLGIFLANKSYDLVLKHDQVQAQIAHDQAVVAANKFNDDDKRNQALLAQLAQLQNSYNNLTSQVAASIQHRADDTKKEKQINDNSGPSELAAYIQKQIGTGAVTAVSGGVMFDLPAAHADADILADIKQYQGDAIDLKTQVDACKVLADKQADTITSLNTQIVDGKDALSTEQNSHAKDVKELKDTIRVEKRKSWVNGFKWGAVAGFVGGLFVPKVHVP